MIWKALYDFEKPNWKSFGRVLFVEADTAEDAKSAAWIAAAEAEPDARITRLDLTRSSEAVRRAYQLKVEAMELWKTNVAHGIPNSRWIL